MGLHEVRAVQVERLHDLQKRKQTALTSGKAEDSDYYTLEEWLRVLDDNIVSCADSIAHIDEAIESEASVDSIRGRFASRNFNTFKRDLQPKAFDMSYMVAQEIASGEHANLFLTGGIGTGKTHLAASIAHYVAEQGIAVKFGNVTDIFQAVRKSFSTNEDALTEIKTVPVLILDDLGKEMNTEWVKETVYSVINYRYEHLLSTIITTNMTMKELANKFGDATISRLKEMCASSYVNMNGEDYRL